jgi:prepilin-type processing-associated H-X9-DG protein
MAIDRDERPRPKSSSSSGVLWIVLGVVGGVLLLMCVVVALLGVLLVPAVQKVRDAANRAERANDMKELAIAVINFMQQRNQGPANINDLVPYLNPSSKALSRLRAGEIDVLLNLAPTNKQIDGTSNVIMAWESQPDPAHDGARWVAFVDGHVEWLTPAQFQQARKAKTVGEKMP